jgi:hypothetical protein
VGVRDGVIFLGWVRGGVLVVDLVEWGFKVGWFGGLWFS